MRTFTFIPLMVLLAAVPALADTVLMMAGSQLARGGNSLVYYTISEQRLTFRAGDRLEYDILISPGSPEISGGPDAELDQDPPLRDRPIVDQNGFGPHPKSALPPANGKWCHRALSLDPVAGRRTTLWSLVMEGDKFGDYAFFIGSLGVHHADGSWTWIYNGGRLSAGAGVKSIAGYSRKVIVRPVDRSLVTEGADITRVVKEQIAASDREADVGQLQHDAEMVRSLAALDANGSAYKTYIDAAMRGVETLESAVPLNNEGAVAMMAEVRRQLAHTQPLMKALTAHLIGHGHIDPAWQWEWPEILDVCNKTFSQAIRFMDEYPGFKYSQSSSGLYRLVQEYYPDVFKQMQAKVKKGQWDIVGGRVTEGDTWMISEESHARNFLLAQRYFRKWFGKTATVGFEPDTFGHTWSMPGILKMGGIEDYYFGRGGQGKPLFWWEGPDGIRVLAFDEIASGSWYDSGFDNRILDELVPWKKATGVNDIMWVYGVGNHGGGPTREELNTLEAWKKTPYYPAMEFSTAAGFFDAARKQNLDPIPVISTSLDPRIDGCYTTHSEMKRLNRDAENWTATAETAATIAGLFGAPYPKDRFDELWYDITFNQHHDTLPGTGTHEVYQQSVEELTAVVAESRNIAGASARFIASIVTRPADAPYAVMALNPLGWKHGGEVRFPWPFPAEAREWAAHAPDGSKTPVYITSGESRDNPTGEPMASFTARDVPGFGYTVFAIRPISPVDSAYGKAQIREGADTFVLDNGLITATVRKDNGLITSLFDRRLNGETLAAGGAGNRLEVWYEDQGPSDAWVQRGYTSHEALDGPATVKVLDSSSGRVSLEVYRTYRHSRITQHIVLKADAGQVELPMWVDWQEEGTRQAPTPFLKLACDVAGTDLAFRYEIPFATEQHPRDGREAAALKSGDLSGMEGGITLLNDCKHGYSAEGNTLRLSLIRTPNRLDPTSDKRAHFVRAALAPHAGPYGATQVKLGYEFNQPFAVARVAPSASGRLPQEKSFVTVAGDSIVSTILKRAEDDPKGVLVRMYETEGKPSTVGLTAGVPTSASQWVNFLEDPLSPKTPGTTVQAKMGKFEIRNVIFTAK